MDKFKLLVVQKSSYGKRLHDDVVKKMGADIDWECSKLLFFNNRACAGNIDLCFVKFPIATLLNDGEKGMDVIFIHELIHAF